MERKLYWNTLHGTWEWSQKDTAVAGMVGSCSCHDKKSQNRSYICKHYDQSLLASTLKENDHDVALLTMIENRLVQESGSYPLRFRSYHGYANISYVRSLRRSVANGPKITCAEFVADMFVRARDTAGNVRNGGILFIPTWGVLAYLCTHILHCHFFGT